MRRFSRWFFFILFIVFLLGFLGFMLRKPIMIEAGAYLIEEDRPAPSDAIFVLSGGAEERCAKAAEVWKIFKCPIIPTGELVDGEVLALGMNIPDAGINRLALMRNGVDSTAVSILPKGTSTMEESDAILMHCLVKRYHNIMVVSSKFHTHRMCNIFKEKFSQQGISVRVIGAPPLEYKTLSWWENEKGLIFVNNEYVKLLYYRLKYGV